MDKAPIVADTLEQLAEKISVPSGQLVQTVEEFNAAVQDGTFDATKKDGKKAIGIEPQKSNWAND